MFYKIKCTRGNKEVRISRRFFLSEVAAEFWCQQQNFVFRGVKWELIPTNTNEVSND